jgi:outer membrane lipoprotein-sorting protein
MKAFRWLLAPVVLLSLAVPAAADAIPLATLSQYLNSLTSAESRFTQTNADGSKSGGVLYIKRPGRARFEYDAPMKSLVLAGSGSVAIFDEKSNEPPEQYPLRRTPLNLILAENVNLGQAKMVIGHGEVDGTTRVVAQDPKNPEYGTIEMVFAANPTRLLSWIITDDAGNETYVQLEGLTTGVDLPTRLFDIRAETERRGGSRRGPG